MLAAHEEQLAVHHLDEGISRVERTQRGLSLDVGGQDHVIMWDPRQGEGPHGPAFPGADRGRAAEGDGGQEAQDALVLFDDDGPLADPFEAEEADLGKAGVEVGQDVDGLRHLGQRIAASVEGIADEGHGDAPGDKGDQTPSRAMMPTAASWVILAAILVPSSTVAP